MEKIILGIDPGTNIMGYGLIKVKDNKAEMISMGVIDLRKFADSYLKLGHIFERVTGIIDAYLPDEMAIEAPFFGKNVQSMLKLGRAQGTAIAAAIHDGGTSGSNVATPSETRQKRHGKVYGCHRRTWSRLLPLSADEPTRNRGNTL